MSDSVITLTDVMGVVDHNTFTGNFQGFFNVMNPGFAGSSYGDGSWSSTSNFGSAKAMYFEDNTFTNTLTTDTQAVIDTDGGGGRVVIRHNTFYDYFVGNHGTESPGRTRGARVWEVYSNNFIATAHNLDRVIQYRSGTGMVWGNTTHGQGTNGLFNNGLILRAFRTYDTLNWGTCDGTTVWDLNDGTIYASGTLTSASTGTATDTSKAWTTNQWIPPGAPYSFHDVTQGWGSEIQSNTSNSLTYDSSTNSGTPHTISAGDSYQILRATVCLDQPGRGQSVLLSGPLTPPTSPTPAAWAQNKLEPIYAWQNTWNQVNAPISSNTRRIINNRDWYTDLGASCSGGSCSSGIGMGILSSRPSTCTAGPGGNTNGVAYWATDTNTLYVCNPTNTWTAYYTPFAYPHPITISAGVVNPPSNLTATVN